MSDEEWETIGGESAEGAGGGGGAGFSEAHQLDTGALKRIQEGELTSEAFQPVVQILDIKRMEQTNGERYRLVLSDSVHTGLAMVATQLNEVVRNSVTPFCVVKLNDYICNTVHGRPIMIALGLTVQGNYHSAIGNPEPVEEAGNAPPQQQQQQGNGGPPPQQQQQGYGRTTSLSPSVSSIPGQSGPTDTEGAHAAPGLVAGLADLGLLAGEGEAEVGTLAAAAVEGARAHHARLHASHRNAEGSAAAAAATQHAAPVTFVLIGRSGNGKSSTGNTLVGRTAFVAKRSAASVTRQCSLARGVLPGGGAPVTVVDTPGIFDTDVSVEQTVAQVRQSLELAPEVHALLVVLSLGRYTPEEAEAVARLEGIFGPRTLDMCVVAFTHGDELDEEEDVEADDATMERLLDEYLQSAPPALKELLARCGGRRVVVDNTRAKRGDEAGREAQVRRILAAADPLVRAAEPYSRAILADWERKKAAAGAAAAGLSAEAAGAETVAESLQAQFAHFMQRHDSLEQRTGEVESSTSELRQQFEQERQAMRRELANAQRQADEARARADAIQAELDRKREEQSLFHKCAIM